MSEPAQRQPSVLLVLGQSVPREDALSAAVALAARLSAELHAVFIEEEDLLRAAALPFGTRLTWGPKVAERFEEAAVLNEWRALSEAARQVIEREAHRQRVPMQYRVCRGTRSAELGRKGDVGDLVMFVGAEAPRTSSTARSRVPGNGRQPVKLLYDGSDDAERALAVALSLANSSHPLEVWVAAPQHDSTAELRRRLHSRLGKAVPICDYPEATATRESALRLLRAAGKSVLVLPERTPLAQLVAALSQDVALPCWVVLTR